MYPAAAGQFANTVCEIYGEIQSNILQKKQLAHQVSSLGGQIGSQLISSAVSRNLVNHLTKNRTHVKPDVREKVVVKVLTATTQTRVRRLQCLQLPVRTDLHDGDSCLSVSVQDGVKNRCRTSPPWQQAGVNVEYPAVLQQSAFTISVSEGTDLQVDSMLITYIVQLRVSLTLESILM